MSFPKGMRDALEHGQSRRKAGGWYGAHRFECTRGAYGTLVFHYMQGILFSLWHVESGGTWTVPLTFFGDKRVFERAANSFLRAVETLQREGIR